MVTSVNPASLRVSWKPLPIIHHNGPLTGHVIQYTRVGSSDMMSVNVTSGTMYTISRLVAYSNYSVRVAAMNFNGTGNFSNPVVGISGKGKLNLVARYSFNRNHVHKKLFNPELVLKLNLLYHADKVFKFNIVLL